MKYPYLQHPRSLGAGLQGVYDKKEPPHEFCKYPWHRHQLYHGRHGAHQVGKEFRLEPHNLR